MTGLSDPKPRHDGIDRPHTEYSAPYSTSPNPPRVPYLALFFLTVGCESDTHLLMQEEDIIININN